MVSKVIAALSITLALSCQIWADHGLKFSTAYWHFDEGAGSLSGDSTGHQFGITWSGTAWVTGLKGSKAVQFDGSTAFGTMNRPTELNVSTGQVFAISVWFKRPSNSGPWVEPYVPLLGKWDAPNIGGWFFGFDVNQITANTTYITFFETNNAGQHKQVLWNSNVKNMAFDGKWHCLQMVNFGTGIGTDKLWMYLDGKKLTGYTLGLNTMTGGNINGTAPFFIGRAYNWYWKGIIDDAYLFVGGTVPELENNLKKIWIDGRNKHPNNEN